MTFRHLIEKLEETFTSQEFVKGFYCGDVYDINIKDGIEYPLIVLEPLTYTNLNSVNKYDFRMFYIDRATSCGGNLVDVTSDMVFTINTITNAVNELEDIDMTLNNSFQFFTQDFKDKCCGGFANITVNEYSPYSYCK